MSAFNVDRLNVVGNADIVSVVSVPSVVSVVNVVRITVPVFSVGTVHCIYLSSFHYFCFASCSFVDTVLLIR